MDEPNERWMREALEAARKAGERDEVPIGAVLVRDGELLAMGYNTREHGGRTTGHAEIVALEAYNDRTGQWRLPPGTALYVTAEPCVMCAGALLQARVDAIYYGCDDARNAGLRNLVPLIEAGRFDHRPSRIEGGWLAAEAAAALTRFFARKRQAAAQIRDTAPTI